MRLFDFISAAIFLPAFFGSSVFASTEIDLSGRFGPVRNQGDSGLCHAYVAADMLDEYFGLSKTPRSLSAVGIALDSSVMSSFRNFVSFGPVMNRSGTESADIGSFFIAARTEKICTEQELPSENREQPNPKFLADAYGLDLKAKSQDGEAYKELEQHWKAKRMALRQNCSAWPTEQAYDPVMSTDDLLKLELQEGQSTQIYIDQIVANLNAGRPVAVSYNIRPIVTPEVNPMVLHVSLAVGYEYIENDLVIKIRNSWGPSCKLRSGAPIVGCEDGYLKVPANRLKAHITGISWFRGTLAERWGS